MFQDSNKPYLHHASRMQRILSYLNLADDTQVSDGTLYSTLAALGVIVLWLSLSGCSANTAGWELTAAAEICEKRGGIDHITNTFGTGVVCKDGFFAEVKGKS